MDKTVEQAKNVLVADLEDAPHVLEDPLGEGVTSRKIQDYVFACVTNGISKSDCVDWLYDLYHKQTDDQHFKFQSRIDCSANMLYNFYNYLMKQ